MTFNEKIIADLKDIKNIVVNAITDLTNGKDTDNVKGTSSFLQRCGITSKSSDQEIEIRLNRFGKAYRWTVDGVKSLVSKIKDFFVALYRKVKGWFSKKEAVAAPAAGAAKVIEITAETVAA